MRDTLIRLIKRLVILIIIVFVLPTIFDFGLGIKNVIESKKVFEKENLILEKEIEEMKDKYLK